MIICIAEDRASFEVSIKLLLLSLQKYNPNYPVYLIFPPASDGFVTWLRSLSNVQLIQSREFKNTGVSIKPEILLNLLDRGEREIVWVDSDILLLDDVSNLIEGFDEDTFIATEEALGGRYRDYGGQRARWWGLKVGRVLPFALNSGVLRVTQRHRGLLERWRELMETDAYQEAQRQHYSSRPWHMFTDQDVLTAILSSEEYATVPLKILRRGADIIQYFGPLGYTVRERLNNLTESTPRFVHSQGPKPWEHKWSKVSIRHLGTYMRDVYLDLSPYTLVAETFCEHLRDYDVSWMRPHFKATALMRLVGIYRVPLVGLPLAMMWGCLNVVERLRSLPKRN